MQRFIGQLTGVRFVAAVWVMLYHFQAPLATLGLLVPVVHEFLRVGRLGVDLFFALSGFILTHTYLTKMGPGLTWAASRHFWWLRLARIWPVHFVMLNVAGIAVIAQSKFGSGDATQTATGSTRVDYLKQVLLDPRVGPRPAARLELPRVVAVDGVAGLPALPAPRAGAVPLPRALPHALARASPWVVVLVPLLWYGVAYNGDPYYISDWGSTIRILTEFTAGALTYLIVCGCGRARPTARDRGSSGWRRRCRSRCPILIVVMAVVLGQPAGAAVDGQRPTRHPGRRRPAAEVPPARSCRCSSCGSVRWR